MVKSRGSLVAVVVVIALAAIAGFVLWKRQGTGTEAPVSSTKQQGSGSAVPSAAQQTAGRTAHAVIVVSGPTGPVAGATVRLSRDSADVLTLHAGADGTATAATLEPGTWTISASASGHEPAAAPARELHTGESVRIELTLLAGGRTLTGTVTDASGGPVAGARIDAARLGPRVRPTSAVASTLTANDGTYTLSVAEGQLVVAASEPSYAPQSRYIEVGPAGATANFALVPGGVIEGTVRDEATREPVANAIVEARRDGPALDFGDRARVHAVTGSDGRFRIAGLRPGAYELSGLAGTRASRSPTIVGLGVAEQVTDVELLVGHTPVVRGTVVDEDGAPTAGVSINVYARGLGREQESVSDAKGAFTLVGLPAGQYGLAGRSDTFMPAGMTRIEVASADLEGVKITVKRALKLVGHVEPRQPCEVASERDDSDPLRGGMPSPSVMTGTDGAFEIAPVEAATYMVTARCTSGAHGTQKIAVAPGSAEVVLAVTPGASIAGTVVDAKGKPVAGVTVAANEVTDTERTTIVNGMITSGVQTLSSARGTFEIRGLGAGRYRLVALERGRPLPMKADVTVEVGATEAKTGVSLTVDRPDGVIQGTVIGSDGKPLADAWVSVHIGLEDMLAARPPPGEGHGGSRQVVRYEETDDGGVGAGETAPVLTDATGHFEIGGLARVPMTIVAEARAGALRGQQIGVVPDATVTLRALGITSLSGRVKSATPVAWFTVELQGPTREQRSFAAADGTFSFARVDPGNYTVVVTSSAGNGEAKVSIEPGKPAMVEISLVANAIVIGKLVDASGAPAGGLPLTVIPDTGEPGLRIQLEGPPPTSAPDGSFRIEAKAGRSILVVMAPPTPTTKRGLVLEAGKTTDIGLLRVTGENQSAPP